MTLSKINLLRLFFLLWLLVFVTPSAQSKQVPLAGEERKLLNSLRITPATAWIEAHNFAGKLPDEKTESFIYIFERKPPHLRQS